MPSGAVDPVHSSGRVEPQELGRIHGESSLEYEAPPASPPRSGRDLAFRVVLIATAVMVPFALAAAVFSVRVFERKALDDAGQNLSLVVRRLAADLDQRLQADREVLAAAASHVPPEALADADVAQAFLGGEVALRSMFDDGLSLVDTQGRIVAETPYIEGGRGRLVHDPALLELSRSAQATYISKPFASRHAGGQPTVVVGAEVRDVAGHPLGQLHGRLFLNGRNFLGDLKTARVGKAGYFYLATRDRILVSHPDSSRIMGPVAALGTNTVLDRAIEEGFDGFGETRNREGTPVLLGITAIRSTGWLLGANLPISEARAPFRALAWTWAAVVFLGVAIMFGVFVLLVRRTALPLTRMTAEVQALAGAASPAGHVRADGPAEVTRLAGAFNRLLAVLAAREREARAAADRARRVFDESPLSSAITDLESGRILDANRVFLERLGVAREGVLGRSLLELGLVSPEGHAELRSAVLAGRDGAFDLDTAQPSGERRSYRLTARRMELDGRPVILFVTEDLTDVMKAEAERRKLEAQIQQQQRLESLGVLAGGIAHDFNNLLTPIIASADLALQELPDGHSARKDLEEIVRAGKRGAELTRRILVFGQRKVIESRPIDLNAEVRVAEHMLRRLLGEDVELRLELAPGPCRVLGDATQVQQLVMNLAVNARQAMPRGGQLVVATRAVVVDEDAPWTRRKLEEGRYVVLTVTDTGTGIPKENLGRIFEPFFTTRGPGQGSGLGLATVLAIARQHGGDVTVYSEEGRGSTFNVYLPLASEEPGAAARGVREADTAPRELGRTRVLVVEDDPSVRTLLVRILRDMGCTVLETAGPSEALALPSDPRPDLLVTDVVMPGVDGMELHGRLCARWPALPALFVSGFPAGVATVEDAMAHGRHFLPKPFDVESLQRAVRRALGVAARDPAFLGP
jgi:PAS domain S-box-containing protein